jgi:hypothetical protein
VFHFACDGWKNQATCVHQVLCEAVNLLSNPLKWFLRLLESTFCVAFTCFKASQLSVEDDKCSGQSITSKTTGNTETIRELIHKDCCQTIYELKTPLGSVMEFAKDLNRKFEHMPHYCEVCSPILDK